MNSEILYNKVYEVLKNEDKEFSILSGQGIFYSPELYVAIIIGKIIKANEFLIFNQNVEWIREKDFKNGGPTDFAFQLGDKIVAFELKLRQTIHAYKADINKLKKLDSNFEKYFIALVDSFETDKENDPRITKLENHFPEIKRISKFKSFKTSQDRFKSQIMCTVCIWKV